MIYHLYKWSWISIDLLNVFEICFILYFTPARSIASLNWLLFHDFVFVFVKYQKHSREIY